MIECINWQIVAAHMASIYVSILNSNIVPIKSIPVENWKIYWLSYLNTLQNHTLFFEMVSGNMLRHHYFPCCWQKGFFLECKLSFLFPQLPLVSYVLFEHIQLIFYDNTDWYNTNEKKKKKKLLWHRCKTKMEIELKC